MRRARARLSDVLIQMGISEDVIRAEATDFYAERRFGARLVDRGIITDTQLEIALLRQRMLNHEGTARDMVRLREMQAAASTRRDRVLDEIGAALTRAVTR